MAYNSRIHHRKSIRLKGYDYSRDGFYFITICTQDRKHLFGEIVADVNGEMICHLNKYGEIAKKELYKTSEMRKNIKINCYVIIPNHIQYTPL